jgi:hypothetical protein
MDNEKALKDYELPVSEWKQTTRELHRRIGEFWLHIWYDSEEQMSSRACWQWCVTMKRERRDFLRNGSVPIVTEEDGALAIEGAKSLAMFAVVAFCTGTLLAIKRLGYQVELPVLGEAGRGGVVEPVARCIDCVFDTGGHQCPGGDEGRRAGRCGKGKRS